MCVSVYAPSYAWDDYNIYSGYDTYAICNQTAASMLSMLSYVLVLITIIHKWKTLWYSVTPSRL